MLVGMFLFVKLVMENLYEQGSKRNLLHEIEAYPFPEDIEKA
jgi:hypothetical protein